MIPLPTSRVFRSRWSALWWAFLVIVTAALTIGSGDDHPAAGSDQAVTGASGATVENADLAAVAAMLDAR